MSIPTIQFEAKKHAYRQTQDGVVVSFVVHPNELHAGFAVAPLGTRYMVVAVEITDDEQPLPPGASNGTAVRSSADAGTPTPSKLAGAPGGAKRERALPEKVGMRCNDKRFQEWLYSKGRVTGSAEDAAHWVRTECGVKSRTEILPSTPAGDAWWKLETQYLIETNQIAEERR